jgi:YD repeat-containing protein
VRASETDARGWKRFWSSNYSDTTKRPQLDVTYTYPPGVSVVYPAQNSTVDTLTPTLFAAMIDPYNTPQHWSVYTVCNGERDALTCGASTGWIEGTSYTVPAGVLAGWGKQSCWYVDVSNGIANMGAYGPLCFTPEVPQPPVTSHLAGAPANGEIPGVNPQVGNFSTSVTDANVAVAGPALSVTRSYNSQDLRTTGAFGTGWSTPWDQKIVTDPGNSGNVVVTLASGREVRFGQNFNGSYAPPSGQNLDLTVNAGVWKLRDPSGTIREFTGSPGRLVKVTDADGRIQNYTYSGSQLITVTDAASGRALHVTWNGSNQIASVATDVPAAGQSALTWTYTYSGGKLMSVCTPLGAGSCTSYAYSPSSHYRSVVLDDAPTGYWPLGEASGSVAANVAARTEKQFDGAYNSVNRGATGPLAVTPDKAAIFDGGEQLQRGAARGSGVVQPGAGGRTLVQGGGRHHRCAVRRTELCRHVVEPDAVHRLRRATARHGPGRGHAEHPVRVGGQPVLDRPERPVRQRHPHSGVAVRRDVGGAEVRALPRQHDPHLRQVRRHAEWRTANMTQLWLWDLHGADGQIFLPVRRLRHPGRQVRPVHRLRTARR